MEPDIFFVTNSPYNKLAISDFYFILFLLRDLLTSNWVTWRDLRDRKSDDFFYGESNLINSLKNEAKKKWTSSHIKSVNLLLKVVYRANRT